VLKKTYWQKKKAFEKEEEDRKLQKKLLKKYQT